MVRGGGKNQKIEKPVQVGQGGSSKRRFSQEAMSERTQDAMERRGGLFATPGERLRTALLWGPESRVVGEKSNASCFSASNVLVS